jgi:hypothetical protein
MELSEDLKELLRRTPPLAELDLHRLHLDAMEAMSDDEDDPDEDSITGPLPNPIA